MWFARSEALRYCWTCVAPATHQRLARFAYGRRCLLACSTAAGLCGCAEPPPPAVVLMPESVPSQIASSAQVQPAEPTGSAFAVMQGRLAIETLGGATSVWMDIEVQGPADAAMRACTALARQELTKRYPDETGLRPVLVRRCSIQAMAEPESADAYALVQVDHPDDLELMLLAPNDDQVQGSVRVRRRVLTPFADEQECQRALVRIEAEQIRAQRRAMEDADRFKAEQVKRAESEVRKACGRAPGADDCRKAREVERLVKKTMGERREQPPNSDRSALCRRK